MAMPAQSVSPLNVGPVELYHTCKDYAVGGGSNLVVVVWRKHTTLDGVRVCREYVGQRCANRGREFALIAIVEAKASLPDAASRHAIAELLRNGEKCFQVSGLVFEGTGFFAATIRSVVTGITLMAKQQYPHRVFDSVATAARFMELEQHKNNAEPFSASGIGQIVADLRRQVAARD